MTFKKNTSLQKASLKVMFLAHKYADMHSHSFQGNILKQRTEGHAILA